MTAFIIPTLASSYQFNKKNAMTTFINVNFYQDLYQYNDDLYSHYSNEKIVKQVIQQYHFNVTTTFYKLSAYYICINKTGRLR